MLWSSLSIKSAKGSFYYTYIPPSHTYILLTTDSVFRKITYIGYHEPQRKYALFCTKTDFCISSPKL